MRGDPLVCAFLCSYAYDTERRPPGAFDPRCGYSWLWPGVYGGMSDWKRFTCGDSDAQALFCFRESDRTVFVAFRGTDSLRDAVLDLAVAKRRVAFLADTHPGARVHHGFLKQHRSCVAAVREYIQRHEGRARVVVTGHSLGASVAVVTAALLVDELREPGVGCVVFGCPRVGNADFARRVDELLSVRRVTVGRDPVCSVPSRARWRHVGERVWYLNGACARRAGACDPWYNMLVPPNLFCVDDHRMAGYVDAVAADELRGGSCVTPWWRLGHAGIYMAALAATAFLLATT